MSDLNELIKSWDESQQRTIALANSVGSEICRRLKPMYPTITYEVGGYEEGSEMVVIFPGIYPHGGYNKDSVYLERIIRELFPSKEVYFEALKSVSPSDRDMVEKLLTQ